MTGNSAINNIERDIISMSDKEEVYDLSGRKVPADTANNGVYIVRRGRKVSKISRR